MLYLVNLKHDEAWLINSQTLKLMKLSLNELFKLYVSGEDIANLYILGTNPKTGRILQSEDREEIGKFDGFLYRHVGSPMITKIDISQKIPVKMRVSTTAKDYITKLDDIIILKGSHVGIDIWYDGMEYIGLSISPEALDSSVSGFRGIIGIHKDSDGIVWVTNSYMYKKTNYNMVLTHFNEDKLQYYRDVALKQERDKYSFLRSHLLG